MTVSEQIIKQIQSLPESVKVELLDYIAYLEAKTEISRKERADWSALSLSQALRGMENESSLYSSDDIKEFF
jgi:hypothetical protein